MSALVAAFGPGSSLPPDGPPSLLIVRPALRGSLRIGPAMAAAVALVDLLWRKVHHDNRPYITHGTCPASYRLPGTRWAIMPQPGGAAATGPRAKSVR